MAVKRWRHGLELTQASPVPRTAHWLEDKPAGLYDMQDVLGLK
jgi:hypothetical protein